MIILFVEDGLLDLGDVLVGDMILFNFKVCGFCGEEYFIIWFFYSVLGFLGDLL